jgi:hypothetical protein
MIQVKVVDKIETRILCSITIFFLKIVHFVRQCRKIQCSKTGYHHYHHHHRLYTPASSARQVTQDNKAHVLCVLDNSGYTQTCARTQYAVVIAFLQQQWFREGASKFRYTYIACLVKIHVNTPAADTLPKFLLRHPRGCQTKE